MPAAPCRTGYNHAFAFCAPYGAPSMNLFGISDFGLFCMAILALNAGAAFVALGIKLALTKN